MNLSKIVPRAEIEAAVPGSSFIERTKRDLNILAQEEAQFLRELALSSWDYALSGQFRHVNPRLLGDAVDQYDPKLLIKMERALGIKLLHDVYHFRMTVPGDGEPFAEGVFASMYNKRLHIADIKMLNPAKPRQDSEWPDQTHHSLRLFPTLLDNAREVGGEIGAERITLTAANLSLFDAFGKHGFRLADTRSARPAYEGGEGIPMMFVI
jgi:hypothetical protein